MQPDPIGKRLKRLRELRGLTIRALAIQAGVPQSTISQVEAGQRAGAGLRLDTAKRISWALGVGLEALAGPYHEEEADTPNSPTPSAPPQPAKRPRPRKAAPVG
jgi:transcriptional regulator with XRE-family HTH domain